MQFKKYTAYIKICLVIGLGLSAAYYLMHQQKRKEIAIYSSIHQIETVEEEDVYQLKLEYKEYQQLPDFIFEYPKLRILKLGFNELNTFDDRLLNVVTLEELDLSGGMQSAKRWGSMAKERQLTAYDSSSIYNQISFLPEKIDQLIALKFLDVRNNRLKNVPQAIARLVALEELSLQGNLLKELPSGITQLPNLRILNLYSNHLYRLPDFNALGTLTELNVFNNELIALPYSIGSCTKLEILEAANNQIEYLPQSIKACKLLTKIDLSQNKLHDLPLGVVDLDKLHQLNAAHNLVDSLKRHFWQIPNLKELELSHNHIEYVEADSLANQSLTYLNLSHNQLSALPTSLRFDKLETLVLSNNQFDKLPEFVYYLPNLRSLDVGYNQIEQLDVERLKAMPNLKELKIEANPMNSSTTDYLFNELKNLKLVF